MRAEDVEGDRRGMRFALDARDASAKVALPLLGTLQRRERARRRGDGDRAGPGSRSTSPSGCRAAPQVPGRMERIADTPCVVLRDYAHTPDALERALAALRPLTKGRLMVVFGAGGDRDKGKRPLMGAIAARDADLSVVTSDNPRTEDPEQILDDIEAGMGQTPHLRIVDRRAAMLRALSIAKPDDVLLLAGKGHETYQVIGTSTCRWTSARSSRRPSAAPTAGGDMTAYAWSAREVTRALGLPAATWDNVYTGVSTDTRSLKERELFVALKGERFDAHDFLSDARLAGVGAVIVRRDTPRWPGFDWFEVDDTLVALGQLARYRRDAFNGPVVAITGTTGKTSTKELAAAALGARFQVHRSERNLNNLVGVPLTLLAIPVEAEAAVIECGASVPGEIPRQRDIARPDVAVVTTVDAGHLEGFGSLERLFEEKVSLLAGAATAVVGTAPPRLAEAARRSAKQVVTAGSGQGDWTADDVTLLPDGRPRFSVRGVAVELPLPGRHMVANALVALAVADAWAFRSPMPRRRSPRRASRPGAPRCWSWTGSPSSTTPTTPTRRRSPPRSICWPRSAATGARSSWRARCASWARLGRAARRGRRADRRGAARRGGGDRRVRPRLRGAEGEAEGPAADRRDAGGRGRAAGGGPEAGRRRAPQGLPRRPARDDHSAALARPSGHEASEAHA